MATAAARQRMSYADYLAAEAESDGRHEFVEGDAWAMAGGSRAHGLVSAAVTIALGSALRGRPCRVGNSDTRVHLPTLGDSVYPDVHVVCGKPTFAEADPDAVTNPVLVVEVLSPSTERWDRGGKFRRYETLPSLREILLLEPDERRAELFRRNDDGTFTRFVFSGDQAIDLRSVDVQVPLADVYAGVEAEREAAG